MILSRIPTQEEQITVSWTSASFQAPYWHSQQRLSTPTDRLTKHSQDQIERSPGDTFVYECLADPMTRFPTPFYHPDALIIAAAGSYQSDRHCYPGPRAGYAVFVGPFNKLNTGGMPVAKVPGQWISLQRGELAGAVAAMEVVMKILDRGSATDKPLRRVVVKTDSEYVVKGITDRFVLFSSIAPSLSLSPGSYEGTMSCPVFFFRILFGFCS